MDMNKKYLSVVFFRTEAGHEPVREWLKELTIQERKIIPDFAKQNPPEGPPG